jgi:hypothetical protein
MTGINPVLAKYGNAGDKANQQMAAQRATTRLTNLARQEQKVTDSKQRASKMPLMPGQLPASGYTGERDYFDSLNRQGEIASLTSELEGKGPVTARYGGTIGASPVQRLQQRAGSGALDAADYDPRQADDDAHLHKMRTMDIEDRITNRETSRLDALRRAAADPDHDIFSGKAGKRVGEIDKINAASTIAAGDAKTQADVNDYFGKEDMRRDLHFDTVRRTAELFPYNRYNVEGDTRRYVADANAGAKVDAAQIGGDARVGAAAIGGIARTGSAMPMTPEDNARVNQSQGAILPNVPGQAQQGPPKPFPRAMLGAWARENGMTEGQAEEWLKTVANRVVQ